MSFLLEFPALLIMRLLVEASLRLQKGEDGQMEFAEGFAEALIGSPWFKARCAAPPANTRLLRREFRVGVPAPIRLYVYRAIRYEEEALREAQSERQRLLGAFR